MKSQHKLFSHTVAQNQSNQAPHDAHPIVVVSCVNGSALVSVVQASNYTHENGVDTSPSPATSLWQSVFCSLAQALGRELLVLHRLWQRRHLAAQVQMAKQSRAEQSVGEARRQ